MQPSTTQLQTAIQQRLEARFGTADITNPTPHNLHLELINMPKPLHSSAADYLMSIQYLCKFYQPLGSAWFTFDGITFVGCAKTLIHQYLMQNPSKKIVTWLQDNAIEPSTVR